MPKELIDSEELAALKGEKFELTLMLSLVMLSQGGKIHLPKEQAMALQDQLGGKALHVEIGEDGITLSMEDATTAMLMAAMMNSGIDPSILN